jgi:hypothetical protein
MRRTGNLYDAIHDPENLRLAFCKARRGKEDRREVRKFARDLEGNLSRLRDDLAGETAAVGEYRHFRVRDPKERTIYAAAFPERVLHHAVMNVCDPVFERFQIFDSYATRRGKGTFAALERARRFTGSNAWFLKLDVRKYFDSVDHGILKGQLRRLFRELPLLRLLDRIIDSYAAAPGKGIPIGNLTSQYFANHYLALADHFVKEELRGGAYVRYMDDMALWGNDGQALLRTGREFERFLFDCLALRLKPECLNRCEEGMPFLGFRLFPGVMRLGQGSRRRFRRKMRGACLAFEEEEIGQEEFGRRTGALAAHVAHAASRRFRQRVLENLGRRPGARTA